MFVISGRVSFKSNALESTILKIFCTLMEWLVEQKMRLAFMALAKRLACREISSWSSSGRLANRSNLVPTRNGIAVYLVRK